LISKSAEQTQISNISEIWIDFGEDDDDNDDEAAAFCTTVLSFRSKQKIIHESLNYELLNPKIKLEKCQSK
jgi:hypothetical protein